MFGRGFAADRRRLLKTAALGALAASVPRPALASQAYAGPQAFEGRLLSRSGPRLEILVGDDRRYVDLVPNTRIWRGGLTEDTSIVPGDHVLVRHAAGRPVDAVWANLSRAQGHIRGRDGRGYVLSLADRRHPGAAMGLAIAPDAEYVEFLSGGATRAVPLPNGALVDAIGVQLDGMIVATNLAVAQPGATQTNIPLPGPELVSTDVLTGDCLWQLSGYATWYNCPNGAGRCGTCNGTSAQTAWPAFDSCGCCDFNCCDCSKGCRNQHYLSCGHLVEVNDLCGGIARWLTVVDCGPCQKHTGCTVCGDLCNRTCADCFGHQTAIVDLTKPSFSVHYNPDTRGCFSCRVRYYAPC